MNNLQDIVNTRLQDPTAYLASTFNEDISAIAPTYSQETDSYCVADYEADVEDVAPEKPASDEKFLPVEHLKICLAKYLPEAEVLAWVTDIHEDAMDPSVSVEQRMFLVNRVLRLKISEMKDRDTMRGRMLVSDQLSSQEWAVVIAKAVVPFIAGKLVAGNSKPAAKLGNTRMDKAKAAKKARKLAQKQRAANR